MTPFYTILTNYGKTVLAEALAAQQPLEIPHMAAGDGGGAYYDPIEEQTNLRNELWRGDLNDLRTDEGVQGQVIAEAIIPMGIDGDWTVREIGLFDAKGGLIAVGKYPENYIPPASSGAKSQIHISIIINVDNVAAVQLIVDHGQVLASKLYVSQSIEGVRDDLQNAIKKLSKGYLSEHDGDLQSLVNQAVNVYIDEDCDVTREIIIPSHTHIETTQGAKLHFKGGMFRTKAKKSSTYFNDTNDNKQRVITAPIASGDARLFLNDTSELSVGDKLVLRNGYCDMWRVLEQAANPLFAVEEQPYKSELVIITGINGTEVSTSPIKYHYPLTPVTYGHFPDENALNQYSGFTRPSATKLLYKNISLDIDIEIHAEQSADIGTLSFIDGIDVSVRSHCRSNSVTPLVITMSDNVNVHDVAGYHHVGKFIGVQETCRGSMTKLRMTAWRGGGDTPFLAMVMSDVNIDDVWVEASVKHTSASAVYINTCDGGSISNVSSKNTPKVVDFSFSRGVLCHKLRGYNADAVAGGYNSVGCSADDGILMGYCFLNATSTIYKNALLPTFYTINNYFSNIRRINDMGYGRVLLENTVGLTLKDVHSDKTLLNIFIKNKEVEFAQGSRALIASIEKCTFGEMLRQSSFYDASNENNRDYPKVLIHKAHFNGLVNLGTGCNPLDHYDVYTDTGIQIGSSCFGVTLSGYAKSLTLASDANKFTCIPRISELRLNEKPATGSFISIDDIIPGSGTLGHTYYNGTIITDIYSRQSWVNTGIRGAAKWAKI